MLVCSDDSSFTARSYSGEGYKRVTDNTVTTTEFTTRRTIRGTAYFSGTIAVSAMARHGTALVLGDDTKGELSDPVLQFGFVT
jgi:hypothetical protein